MILAKDELDQTESKAVCKNPPKKKAKDTKKSTPGTELKTAPEPKSPDTDTNPKDDSVAKIKDASSDVEKKDDSVAKIEDASADAEEKDDEPKPRTYTPEEIENIAAKVEIYKDVTPVYKPKHMLSPEFKGTSNYERSIKEFRTQGKAELDRLCADSTSTPIEITQAKDNLRILDHLYENYHLGMNVFRTAKGGRSKLRV